MSKVFSSGVPIRKIPDGMVFTVKVFKVFRSVILTRQVGGNIMSKTAGVTLVEENCNIK